MNAYTPPDRAAEVSGPSPLAPVDAADGCNPAWPISPSPFDWQVMIYGGINPRNGFPQEPLTFQFYAGHYSRQRVEQRAADLAEREHRTNWIVRDATGRIADEVAIARDAKRFNRENRRTGGRA